MAGIDALTLEVTFEARTLAAVTRLWENPQESDGITEDVANQFMSDMIALIERAAGKPRVTGTVALSTAWLLSDILERFVRTIDRSSVDAPSALEGDLVVLRAAAAGDLDRLDRRLGEHMGGVVARVASRELRASPGRRRWFGKR